MKNLSTRLRAWALGLVFLTLAAAFIPAAGIQNDEALFAAPYYQESARQFCITVFHKRIVLMVMSYIGTLKTALYGPIFAIFGANVWSVRLPMVLAGALTVCVFFYLVQRSAGPKVALLAAALLATDPSFLLTDTFDWGPVALEHLLLVTGCFLVLRSAQESLDIKRSMRDLGLGFAFLGLGLWNKAIFGWALAGLIIAALIVFWPEVRKMATRRRLAVAGIAFLFGCLPFVTYNLRHPFDTLRQNAHREDPEMVLQKLRMLDRTLDGSGLLGFVSLEDWAAVSPKNPGATQGFLYARLGHVRQSGMAFAFGLALLLIPLWWRSRAARFALIFMLVDWSMMASTRGAGGAVHHSVLLWPMPQLFVAVTFASPWRRIAGAAGAVLVILNLLMLNDYLYKFQRNGAAGNFTDALFPLSAAIADSPRPVYIMDWGMQNTLSLLHRGRIDLRAGDTAITAGDQHYIDTMFSDPETLFVDHVKSREVFEGVRDGLDRAAAKAGKREQILRTIYDSNGRAVFEIFHMVGE